MKKANLILLMASMICACAGQNNTYYLHGSFSNSRSSKVYLISAGKVIDTATVDKDRQFSFNGTATTPPILAEVADAPSTRAANNTCKVILEPGLLTVYPLEGTSDYYVTGSKSNDLITGMANKSMELDNYFIQHKDEDDVYEKVDEQWNSYLEQNTRKYTDNMFGLVCLDELKYELDPNDTRKMLDAFDPDIRNTDTWKQLDQYNRKMLPTAPGNKYIEFSQTDLNGNLISTKDVLATPGVKYVLIDFWASWCGPCMREVPYLKETYSKYFDKGFQILGVSLDRSRNPWLMAIENNQMNWIHVSELNYWDNSVAKKYAVSSIPSNFLVDASTGMIIATNLRGKKLEKKIAELLK